MPDLDEIAVWITHVAANLHAVVLWLGQEFGTSASPLLVRGPDVGETPHRAKRGSNLRFTFKPMKKPDYGIDSPAIVETLFLLGGLLICVAVLLFFLHRPHLFGIPLGEICLVVGAYFFLYACSMIWYSKAGKQQIRKQLLGLIQWHGDEMVLDVGCGRGLLMIGAAQRLTSGKAIGVDSWVRGALSKNTPEEVLRNAQVEGVADRVEVKEGDARHLPFADNGFNVVVSNFVLHEMDSHNERTQMVREMIHVLKPGGQFALADFIFTGECVQVLKESGIGDAKRVPVGSWYFAILNFGFLRTYCVRGSKTLIEPEN